MEKRQRGRTFAPLLSRLERWRKNDEVVCLFHAFSIKPSNVGDAIAEMDAEHPEYPNAFKVSLSEIVTVCEGGAWKACLAVLRSMSLCLLDLGGYFREVTWAADDQDQEEALPESTSSQPAVDPTFVDQELFDEHRGKVFDRMRMDCRSYCESQRNWKIKSGKESCCSQVQVAVLHVGRKSRVIAIPDAGNVHRLIYELCPSHEDQDDFLRHLKRLATLYKQKGIYAKQDEVFQYHLALVEPLNLVKLSTDSEERKTA